MAKRMILMLVLMAILIGGLGLLKLRQFQAMADEFAAMQPPPEAVTTIVTEREEWPATLDAIGTVAAVQGVTVSADLPGVVDRIAFDSGRTVRQGRRARAARHAAGASAARRRRVAAASSRA